MAQNKPFRFGPIALTNTLTTNLLNPGTTTGGVNAGTPQNLFFLLKHLRVVNKTGGAVTVSLWMGATGGNVAGTEFEWQATSVPANSFLDVYPVNCRMDVSDFLVGGAGAATSLTLQGEAEVGIA